jgi:hypothetical protein
MFVGATPAVGIVPVPLSVTDCVPGVALSLTCNVAVRAPVAVGLNVTPMTHVPLVAATTRLFAQFVPVAATIAKSPAFVPVMVTAFAAASVTDAVPVLLNVTVVVPLVELIRWLPNGTGEGVSVTLAAVPVPVSGTVCGLPVASSATLTFALLAPVAIGENLTPTLQLAAAFNALAPSGHAVPLLGAPTLKSPGLAPVKLMLVMFSVAVPVFVIATLRVALCVLTT